MKLIKTAIPNRYINEDAIIELYIDKGGEIISEDSSDCYKIVAHMQNQQYPVVLGAYDSMRKAEAELESLVKRVSTTKAV